MIVPDGGKNKVPANQDAVIFYQQREQTIGYRGERHRFEVLLRQLQRRVILIEDDSVID